MCMTKKAYEAATNRTNDIEKTTMYAGVNKKALGGIFKATPDASKAVQALKELIENGKINIEKENIKNSTSKIPNIIVELKKFKDYTLVSVASDGDTSTMDPKAIIDYGVWHFKTASSNYGTGFKSSDGYLTDGIGHSYIYILREGFYEVIETTNWPNCTTCVVEITESNPWPFGDSTSVCTFEVPADKEDEILEGLDEEHIAWAFFPDVYRRRMRLVFNGKDLSSDNYMRRFLKGVNVHTDSRVLSDGLSIEWYQFETVKPGSVNSIFEKCQGTQGVYQFANGRCVENSRFHTIVERRYVSGAKTWFKKEFTHPALNGVKWAFNVYSNNGSFMEYPYSGNDKSAVNWRSKSNDGLASKIRAIEDRVAGNTVREVYASSAIDTISTILNNGFELASNLTPWLFVKKSDYPKEIKNGYENNRLPDGIICGKDSEGNPDFDDVQLFIKYKKGVVRDEDIDQPIRFGEYMNVSSRRVLIIGTELHKYAEKHLENIHAKADESLRNAKDAMSFAQKLLKLSDEENIRELYANAKTQLENAKKHDDIRITFVAWDKLGLNPKELKKDDFVSYTDIIDICNNAQAVA